MTSPAQAPRTVPPSRLFATLMAEAEQSTNRNAWARTVCRAAAHQARAGQAARALSMITSVRQVYGTKLHHDVAPWLMLAEGVLHFSKYEAGFAYDRIIRAHALGAALKSPATATCAGWMAQLNFNRNHFEESFDYLNKAFDAADPKDHEAHARADMVLANAYAFAGRHDLALPWFEQARRHVVALGDEAMFGAMLYNVAVMRMVNLRLDDVFGSPNPNDLIRMRLESGGSASFDYMTGNSAQVLWRVLMRARQLLLNEKHQEAKSQFEKLLGKEIGSPTSDATVYVDLAWCEFKLGNDDSAAAYCRQALEHEASLTDADDEAYAFGRLAQMPNLLDDPSVVPTLQERAADALTKHRALQSFVLEQLASVRSKRVL